MKIVTVVGARPQFIKAAMVSRKLRERQEEILVHTGQHYDYNMSRQFFEELDIPEPDYNLGISGGTHGKMTGHMLMAIEDVLAEEKPDKLLIYGDTNSTLAASLAAAKLHVPICHVEAGARTHCMTNPEEINRICADHISTLLLACTQSGIEELEKEGLGDRSFLVGDLMYDAFIHYSQAKDIRDIELTRLNGTTMKMPEKYYYLTCHREENTDRDEDLREILKAADSLDALTIYPVHPRNKKRAIRLQEAYGFKNVILTEPVGYLASICMVKNAIKIITDSGGLQREAFFAKKKCVTVLDFVVWPETMTEGRNVLSKPRADEIIKRIEEPQTIDNSYMPFGDGNAAAKIIDRLTE